MWLAWVGHMLPLHTLLSGHFPLSPARGLSYKSRAERKTEEWSLTSLSRHLITPCATNITYCTNNLTHVFAQHSPLLALGWGVLPQGHCGPSSLSKCYVTSTNKLYILLYTNYLILSTIVLYLHVNNFADR